MRKALKIMARLVLSLVVISAIAFIVSATPPAVVVWNRLALAIAAGFQVSPDKIVAAIDLKTRFIISFLFILWVYAQLLTAASEKRFHEEYWDSPEEKIQRQLEYRAWSSDNY